MMSLAEVNAMPEDEFVRRFGDVAERSPWVAERAAAGRPFQTREAMVAAFDRVVREASEPERLALVRAHPDLAGRAAIAGELTEDSRKEQSSAGLDRLTPEEFGRFTELNSRYRARFGIPFIFAVKGATKHQILENFEERIGNDHAAEHANALDQVCRILRFRIAERVAE
jgi:2-oxo-4-hydroxy-4-carboxy-5-ureidoimidazoline decarboxylase